MSIFDRIAAYADSRPLRFHTPGHKGAYDRWDVTEIEDVFPLSEIERAERATAALYGVPYLRYLTNGSSIGLKAAILAAPGDILTDDIAHRAVAEGAQLAGKKLYTYTRRIVNGLAVPPTADEVLTAAERQGVRTVVLTTPDYYGRTVDGSVLKAVKAAGYTLIADSAHGAHFPFSPRFPEPAYRYADMCNMSAHKTLGAYTQSAYLAVPSAEYIPAVERALTLLGTTSPSYLLLGGLERAATDAAGAAERYEQLYRAITDLKERFAFADNDDFTRPVLDAGAYGMTGHELYAALLQKGVAAEKYDDRYAVFIVTMYDTPADIAALSERIGEVIG